MSKNGTLTWTDEAKRKKKKKRKVQPIPIVRIDTANKAELEAYRNDGFVFKTIPMVFIVKNGMVRALDQHAHFDTDMTLHHLNRMAHSLIEL